MRKVGPDWPRRSWESDDTHHDCGAEVGTQPPSPARAVDRLKEDAHISFAELAMVLRYFDQAHFNRDFRTIVGCTPAAYTRRHYENS